MIAKTCGTAVRVADDDQLASMWTEVLNLMKIEFDADSREEEDFTENLKDLNDWLRRQYGPEGITCEDVRLAYNWLVMEKLTKAEGRILEAYPKINARHVGEVLAAYSRKVTDDLVVNRVISQGLYLPPASTEPTQEEIDALMRQAYGEAIEEVRAGREYFDRGNGLFTWLEANWIIKPTQQDVAHYMRLASQQVPQVLVTQKQQATKPTLMREKLTKTLGSVIKQDATKDVMGSIRGEAKRLCLLDHLRKQAGLDAAVPLTPSDMRKVGDTDIYGIATDGQKPFAHYEYVTQLKGQLPTMPQASLLQLQKQALERNVLDVYTLTTAEIETRQEKLKAKPNAKKKAKQ